MRDVAKLLIPLTSVVFLVAVHNPIYVLAATLSNYNVGVEPKAVAVADFNNDGKQDLATVNRGSHTVSILLGDGSGNFGAANNFSTGDTFSEPSAIVAGDFNNDGKTDVVVSKPNVHLISLMLGNGNGGLGTPSDFSVGENPGTSAVGDFNGDGSSDLAVADAGFNQGGIYVLLGTGTGSFGSPTKFTAGTRPANLVPADFNRDNKIDLAVANVGFGFNKISLLIGNGGGGFSAPTDFVVGTTPSGLAARDFNKDGFLDLAVSNLESHNVSILKGDGQGGFGAATNFPANSSPASMTAGDFDGDGKIDLAVGSNVTGDRISILRGDDTGQFAAPASFSAGSGPYNLVARDLNGDAGAELVIANASSNTVSVWIGPLPSIAVAAATPVVEGNSGTVPATLPLSLSSSVNRDVTISCLITNGTTSASDFGSGAISPVTIPAGMLAGGIVVPVNGDRTYELDETFTVNITSALNAFINVGQAQGTILNDDPIPSISITDFSNTEGSITFFIISLTNPSFQQISVTVATADGTAAAGSDYTPQTSTIKIPAGQTEDTFFVDTIGDTVSEPNETFFVNLSNPVNATIARSQGIGTILDNDAAALLVDGSQRAFAVDSVTFVRDPFAIEDNHNFSSDHRTLIELFAVDLNLVAGDMITVQAEDAQHVIHQLPVEFAGAVPSLGGLWAIVVKLPNDLTPGDYFVSFTLRGAPSNKGLITIQP